MRQELMAIFKSADTKGIPDGKLNQAEILHRLSKIQNNLQPLPFR